MRLRDLDTIDDFDAAVRLQHEVWGAGYDDIVPRSVFIVAARTGGVLIGAEDDSRRLVGCVFSMPGLRHGRVMQWSHLLGVASIAAVAKFFQRDESSMRRILRKRFEAA